MAKQHKLDMFKQVLPALDNKDIGFHKNLTDEERNSIAPPVVMRWMSTIDTPKYSSSDPCPITSEYYILSVNHYVNKHLYDIPNNRNIDNSGIIWGLLCGASPGVGKQQHGWIGLSKQKPNKKKQLLMSYFPDWKEDDISVLAEITHDTDIKKFIKSYGESDKP